MPHNLLFLKKFICSSPGHSTLMAGTLVVSKDPAAYLLAQPEE